MTATSVVSHTLSRWSTTPDAASAASFHPSNAAMSTGDLSGGTSSISITPPAYADDEPVQGTLETLVTIRLPARSGAIRLLQWEPVNESAAHPAPDLVRPDLTEELSTALRERILVIDGAMGTLIQRHGLGEADYRGERFADHDR